jgi:hypothetical protein
MLAENREEILCAGAAMCKLRGEVLQESQKSLVSDAVTHSL